MISWNSEGTLISLTFNAPNIPGWQKAVQATMATLYLFVEVLNKDLEKQSRVENKHIPWM